MSKEAMKQALEALENDSVEKNAINTAKVFLRQAIAEAEQPVRVTDELVNAYCEAWKQIFLSDNACHTVFMSQDERKHIEAVLKAARTEQAPTQRKPLTDEELAKVCGFSEYTTTSTRIILTDIARAIERALQEKNT